jgi:hypothetical protein
MRVKQYWPDIVTQKSWERLQKLSGEVGFTLIGGWAVYLWTKQQKSKDIDIVVGYAALEQLRERYDLRKNARLKKYEIKEADSDIDIYVPHFSKLALPAQDILSKYTTTIEGIRVVVLEALVLLKQAALSERRESVKGEKDIADILSLFIHADVDMRAYMRLVRKYGPDHRQNLEKIVRDYDPKKAHYLGLSHKQFTDWRGGFLGKLKAAQ